MVTSLTVDPPTLQTNSLSPDCVIDLSHVTLWRRTQEEFHYDLKRLVFAVLQRKYRRPQRRRVLHDVTLSISRGEKLGIIGANGSGKSTLLKIIAGILKPTSGTVSVSGTIAPLIELGAGFDADLSLVDNIVYYGILLGRERNEMRSRIDAILDFAELEDHAREPLKALSSGMLARLGFAIATDVRPEILILDEVLSVGDESFRRKCSERMARFWDAHSTIIVVSHDPAFIMQQCETAMLLEDGAVIAHGSTHDVVREYGDRQAAARAVLDREMIERLNGRVVRGDGSSFEEQGIYLIEDGRKHHVPNKAWLDEAGIRWPDDVLFLPGGTVQGIPDGDPVP